MQKLTKKNQPEFHPVGSQVVRKIIILTVFVVVSALHFFTATEGNSVHVWHILFRKLYFLPIVMGAVWFGLTGALATVAGVVLVYFVHMQVNWSFVSWERADQFGELASFVVLGLVAGFLVQIERRFRERAEHEKITTSVATLVETLGARDPDTLEHSQRVAVMVRDFGRWQGLTKNEQNDLYLAGLLHDVGKIGVRDDILFKPASLSKEEVDMIMQHPHIAEKILAPVGFLTVIEIVRAHHENVDGTGYPEGLTGDQIPEGAKILAVVDTFDALSSRRSYKKAIKDKKEVFQIMGEMAGTKLDPATLQSFEKFVRKPV